MQKPKKKNEILKKILLLFLSLVTSIYLPAQIPKGSILIESGIYLGGNGGYYWSAPFIGTTGISFRYAGNYTENYSDGSSRLYHKQNILSYSLAPAIGYALFNNLVIGADLQYHRNMSYLKLFEHIPSSYRSFLYGAFIRPCLGKGRIQPVAEIGTGFGHSKSKEDETSPGGANYQRIECRNIFYLSVSAGLSYSISPKTRINLQVKAQQTTERPIDTEHFSFSESKISNFETALIMSFSYLLNRSFW